MTAQFKSTSDFIHWNEAMTRKYDSEDYHLRSNFVIRWIEHRRVEVILRFLEARPGDTVVEIGCGAGVVLEQIPASHLLGLDLSGFILQKTQRRLSSPRLGQRRLTLLQANAESLPLAANQFKKILCTEVIEHVLEPRNVVREMARVATVNAVLVITIPNEALIDRVKALINKVRLSRWLLQGNGNDSHQAAYNSPADANEWHLHRFDLPLLRRVTKNVLVIDEIKAVPFRFLPLRYVVRCRVTSTND